MKKLAITLNLIIFIPPLITLLLDILLWCLSLFTEYYEHESMFGPHFIVFYCCFFFVIFVSIMSVIHILKENNKTLLFNILNGLMLLPAIGFLGVFIEDGLRVDFFNIFLLLFLPTYALNLIYVNKYKRHDLPVTSD